ncbi:MAG: hypothetical protein RL497_2401 [Pseudomonadota bacterium]|jgi:hypothetical protein
MGLEVLDHATEAGGQGFEEVIVDKVDKVDKEAPKADTDSRRRLEDKLEEVRLRRELREYDFDI